MTKSGAGLGWCSCCDITCSTEVVCDTAVQIGEKAEITCLRD